MLSPSLIQRSEVLVGIATPTVMSAGLTEADASRWPPVVVLEPQRPQAVRASAAMAATARQSCASLVLLLVVEAGGRRSGRSRSRTVTVAGGCARECLVLGGQSPRASRW